MARILHLISSNQRRGAETFGVELADALRDRNHDVRVLAVRGVAAGPHLDVELAGRHRLDPTGLARTIRAARQSDVVVSFGSISLQAAAFAAAAARRPFVYRNIGDPAAWQSVRASDIRVGWPLRRAAAVVAVFPDAGAEIMRRYRIPTERVRTIPRGVPADRFQPSDDETRSNARVALGLAPGRWVAWVGSLSDEKDPLLAIEAVALTKEVGLALCGDGPLSSRVRAQSVLDSHRIAVLGPVDDVRTVFAAADALLLTSRTEGVPGVVIEAGLSGLPTVAAAVGGVGDVVLDGQTGYLVTDRDPATFARRIELAVQEREVLGGAARRRCAEEFSMANVADRWDELIREVLAC